MVLLLLCLAETGITPGILEDLEVISIDRGFKVTCMCKYLPSVLVLGGLPDRRTWLTMDSNDGTGYKCLTHSASACVATQSRSCFGFKPFSWLGKEQTSPGPDQNFVRPPHPTPTGGALDPVAPVQLQPRWLGQYQSQLLLPPSFGNKLISAHESQKGRAPSECLPWLGQNSPGDVVLLQ